MPASHIPTTASCDVCHTNFNAFAPASTNHAGTQGPVAAGHCNDCHGGNYTAVNALTKPTSHIPTSSDCSVCHGTGNNYTVWAPAKMNHALAAGPAASGHCVDCHSGTYVAENAQVKPLTHIQTTQSCEICHGTTAWKPTTFAHQGVSIGGLLPTGNPNACSTCHGVSALGRSTSHLPTTAACDACHTNFTAFSPATMNHTATTGPLVAGNCATCHGGAYVSINAQIKPSTHIATGAQCDTCHTGSVSRNYVTWATGTFNHVGVIIGGHACGTSCHNGAPGQGLGKPTTHIPTAAACDVCHTNTTAFAPAAMDHVNTSGPVAVGNCASCHNGSFLFAKATAKPSTHVLTTLQCDTCHTGGYVSWTGATYVHSASAVGNCSNCHNGSTALGKPSAHVPTTGQCSNCHGNYQAFKPAAMNHAGTAGQCSTCHNGSYVAVNALAKPVTHVPTGAQCDTCHTNGFVSFSPSPMNHTGTNSPLAAGNCSTCHSGAYLAQNAQTMPVSHVPTAGAQCDTCHTGSVSRNYTTWATGTFNHPNVVMGGHTCANSCHNGTPNNGLSKPSTHIPVQSSVLLAACDTCHNSFTAFAPATMNHTGTTGACLSCHASGLPYLTVNAQQKTATHISTTAQCDACHGTSAWKPTSYAHNGITIGSLAISGNNACATCHDGASALGRSASHIATSSPCDLCHTNFAAFSPAAMNHAGMSPTVVGNCISCHTGAYLSINAQVKSATHVSTTAQCDTCHNPSVSKNYTTWASASYLHDASAVGNCANCHNGTTALGKPTTHIPTTAQCSVCHTNYTAFKPAVMSHAGTAGPAAVGNCSSCHNGGFKFANALAMPGTHIPTTNQCDTCHKAGYVTWAPATMNHTGLAGQCSTCHGGAYVSQNASSKPATHVSTTAQCDTCHSGSVSKNYTTWATGTFNHAGAGITVTSTACGTSCHTGAAGQGLSKPATHIPTGAACGVCHTDPTFTAFNPATMNHTNTSFPVAAGNCSTCHSGAYTFVNAQAKSASHVVTTAQCDTCHKSTVVWTGASFVHAATAIGTCSTCHNGSTALGKPASTHIPTTAQCDTCHGNYQAFKPAAMNHAGTAGQCSTCHNGSYVAVNALAKPAVTAHVPTGAQCDTCHNNGFTSFNPSPMNHTGTNSPPAASNCSTCHGGTYVAQNAQTMPVSHVPTSGAQCDTCHTGSVSRNYTTWATGTFNHATVVMGGHTCAASCHNGTANKGLSKPSTHIPVQSSVLLAACDTCHNSFTAFAPATMSHTGTNGVCLTCHDSGKPYITVNAQQKTATHIPTGVQQCDVCHGTTAWKPTTYAHQGVTIGGLLPTGNPNACSTCHGVSALGKSAAHIPTAAMCDACHTNFTAFSPATTNHAATSGPAAAGNCSTCHSGTYLSINAQVKSATHVVTSAQCDTCHKSTSTWANATFTHDATAVGKCSTCHNGTTALGKPTTHIPTTAQCSVCHTNYSAFKPAVMSHTGTTGPVAVANCSTCHGGAYVAVNALSKLSTHIPSANQCDTCHKSGYVAWAPATMNHTGLAGQCSTCHSGAYVSQNAQSKPATHIATAAQCDTCHSGSVSANYTTWATGTFNHAGIAITSTACGTSCHTGAAGQGLSKPSTHIPTTSACGVCHTNFTSFNPAVMSHTGITTNCITCHGGAYTAVNAQAKTATHITTTQSCEICHKSTKAWLPATFTHGVADTNCVSCHDGVKATGKPTVHIPISALACSACHRQTAWLPLITPYAHTGIVAGTCATCHINTYPSIDVKLANHVPTTASCEVCHSTSVWNPNLTYAHTGIATGTCATCHTGTYLGVLGKPSNHIPTTTPAGMPGNECSLCHTSKAVGGFATDKMNHGTMQTSCATCHDSTSPYLGSMQKITRGSKHHNSAGKDCSSSGCHKPLGSNGKPYTAWN